ncbi:MAG: hypothetical protein WCY89_03175 [Flavobacteriaceae bacterium]
MKTKILLLITITLLWGCSSDDNTPENPLAQLPPETQTGANTFGCLIDGRVLIPRDGAGTTMGQDRGFRFWGDPTGEMQYNEIDIHDYKSHRTGSILIHIQNLRQIGEGEYIIDRSNGMTSIDGYMHNYIHCRIFSSRTNSYQWYRSFDNSGILTITRFDWENGIISGVFECRAINSSNSNDTIDIKLGRFDFNGYTLPNTQFP